MAKYFIDFEFIEGFHKPLFGKRRHFIDMISVGIVCEDGREYYAISKEFNPKDADEWVYKNVLENIRLDWVKSHSGDRRNWAIDRIEGQGKSGSIKVVQKEAGKSNKQIANEIKDFVYPRIGLLPEGFHDKKYDNPEFYGYYSEYDWVLLCSIFGRMIDLPKGFPMYCIDLKQTLDEGAAYCLKNCCTNEWRYDKFIKESVNAGIPSYKNIEEALEGIKANKKFPKQQNEHNALADAKWNKALYEFLIKP